MVESRAPDEGESRSELETVLDGCRASHRRLLGTVAGLDEAGVRAPSRLEGWSVGHALTHLARNADSHTRMLSAALRGDAVEQYAGGGEERAGAIEGGAHRPVSELRDDVTRSTADLEAAWEAMTPQAWDGNGLSRGRRWPCRSLPYFRWREVEIHHVDLGMGYEAQDWPDEYVRRELPIMLATVPDRLGDATARRRLLAWLTGRATSPGSLGLARWESRPGHYFRGISD
ncbi:MAG TPA: maleylpyruvate isomerase N-terminal domain-containing protein [Acidimicrobiales bacterium]|nr:maleylpyruvate isomerase N-terminal domain-containing protein [Acidimicrobiales bacterium]